MSHHRTTTTTRDHAVVLGASIAGMLAARVLSDHYARVTVIERDDVPEGPAHRRGVPQGRHVHDQRHTSTPCTHAAWPSSRSCSRGSPASWSRRASPR